MQRSTDLREPSLSGHMYISVPASVAQGKSPKWGQKCCKHQKEHWEVGYELVSLRNGRINKMGTTAIAIDTYTWKEESLGAPPQIKN